jgi:copper(I)-binding protein
MTRPSQLPALALLTLGLAACGQPAVEAPAVVEVTDAVCRPTQAGRPVTGCYMTLTASRNDRLVSVAFSGAERGEIHEMSMADGMMRMAELPDGLPLPAGEAVQLRPGGEHIMLLGLDQPLAEGERLALTLTFEQAAPQTVEASVAQPAAAPAGHSGH